MIIQKYEAFLSERKAEWLKKKSKGKEIKPELNESADKRYDCYNWLNKAVRSASHSITTHPSTYTHSKAKTTSVYFQQEQKNNGYLSTNNIRIKQDIDASGNAATDSIVIETFMFLTILLEDGKTVWQHFDESSKEVLSFVEKYNQDFNQIKLKFKKIFFDSNLAKTSELVKQVYLPIENNSYHLLSILTPSISITELLRRIDSLQFSEETKQARGLRRENKYHASGFEEYLNLTEIGFGGSKPQNISVLNSQNAGRAYLLPSIPPTLERRQIRLPNRNFFKQNLYGKSYLAAFTKLHKFMKDDINNIHVRNAIKNIIQYIFEQILFVALKVRQTQPGWSTGEGYQKLSLNQKIWLDDFYKQQRSEQNEWKDFIIKQIVVWFFESYEDLIQGAYKLGDDEFISAREILRKILQENKEFF